jgi:TatA/E family protein of Tat protein translocase
VFNIGPLELLVVLIIALIVLGPQRLPEVARSVGRGMREFRAALDRDDEDDWEPETEPAAEHALEPAARHSLEPTEHAPAAATSEHGPERAPAPATTPAPAAAATYQKEAESSESSSSSSGRV